MRKSSVLWLHGLVQIPSYCWRKLLLPTPTQSGADPMACIETYFLSLFPYLHSNHPPANHVLGAYKISLDLLKIQYFQERYSYFS